MTTGGLQRFVDALEQTWTGLASVVDGISDADWMKDTGCPGWTVKDNVAHVASLEILLAGRDEPEHVAPPAPHVREGMGQLMENFVDRRRAWTTDEVLAELRAITAERVSRGIPSILEEAGVRDVRVVVQLADGTDVTADAGAPATTVTIPLEQLVTLFCGRSDGERSGIVVDGDASVGAATVEALSGLTP